MDKVTFFFDRNFGIRLPRAIQYLSPPFQVEWHQAHFRQESPDDEWMAGLSGRGWTVLSHDRKFHSEATENLAVRQHKLGCFYLPCEREPKWDKAAIFFKTYRKMVEIAQTEQHPFIYSISASGRITKVDLG